jgi:hypothetical protein
MRAKTPTIPASVSDAWDAYADAWWDAHESKGDAHEAESHACPYCGAERTPHPEVPGWTVARCDCDNDFNCEG